MKKFLLLFVSMAFAANVSAQQLPNADFENWLTDNKPTSWFVVDTMGLFSTFKTTDAASGTYAALLKPLDTTIIMFDVVIPGIISLGPINPIAQTTGSVPFAFRPDSLIGYYKLPAATDTLIAFVLLTKFDSVAGNVDTIGGFYEELLIGDSNYHRIAIPLEYDTLVPWNLPDSIMFVIMSSCSGCMAYVDNLSFAYSSLGITQYQSVFEDLLLFPNPAEDVLNVHFSHSGSSLIRVFNLAGKEIHSVTVPKSSYILDVSKYPAGMYLMEITIDGKQQLKKFCVY